MANRQVLNEDEGKKNLRYKEPSRTNKNILFPDYYSKGRIIIKKGVRMMDWDGKVWKVFQKEGARWYPDDFNDNDYKTLNNCLKIDQ